jgi:hypothetical protein
MSLDVILRCHVTLKIARTRADFVAVCAQTMRIKTRWRWTQSQANHSLMSNSNDSKRFSGMILVDAMGRLINGIFSS